MSATDRYSHQLLYATVRQRLLDDIAQGVYQAGQQIPTETKSLDSITSAALPFAKPSAT